MYDQYLMDRLMAEKKKEPGQDMEVLFQEAVSVGVEDEDTAVVRQLREDMESNGRKDPMELLIALFLNFSPPPSSGLGILLFNTL